MCTWIWRSYLTKLLFYVVSSYFSFVFLFFIHVAYSTCRCFQGLLDSISLLRYRLLIYIGSYLAHVAPSLLPSHKDAEAEIWEKWVIWHYSMMADKSQWLTAVRTQRLKDFQLSTQCADHLAIASLLDPFSSISILSQFLL